MKEIVVLSGKGGTGKTSVAASFAVLAGDSVVVADCDVDAADMHLLLAPDFAGEEVFHAGELPRIDPDLCDGCDRCREVCRFGAIAVDDGLHAVDPLACEGCGYCARVCPTGAIVDETRRVGVTYASTIRTGAPMVHARLDIGAENSGKLVTKVKNEARRLAEESGREAVLVDGAPGVGCPVVSSLSGAALVVLVTEPTRSGLHDLERVHDLIDGFGIPAVCILNKADLDAEVRRDMLALLAGRGVPVLAELPYDEAFPRAITRGAAVVERETRYRNELGRCWREILRTVAERTRTEETT